MILEEYPGFKDDDPRVYLALASLQIEHVELHEDSIRYYRKR